MPHSAELGLVTLARFYALGVAEAFVRGTAPAPTDVPLEADLLLHIHAGLDRVIEALGSRVKRPMVAIGTNLEQYAYWIAAWGALPLLRGLGETDDKILKDHFDAAEAALRDIARPNESDRKPYFVDSTPAIHERGPRGGTRAPGDLEALLGGSSGGCH